MAHLRPCDGCLRHVRANETRCPFCDHTLAIDAQAPAPAPSRLGRAARMAFGAAVATASFAAACGGGNKPAETGGPTGGETADAAPATTSEATATATASSPPPPPPNEAKPYGAPPADGLLV